MPTSVFISYSHDSPEHKAFVRSLADQLCIEGLHCTIDQYINGFPPEGWPRWMETQVEQADFVLLVCTETYLKRYRGQDADGGRGVNFEGVVISQTLYDHYYRNTKFIPVIPETGSLDNVPLPLKGFSTYVLPRDYTPLYRVLTDQPATPAPEVGAVKYLPPEKSGGLALRIDFENETIEAASYTTLPVAAVKAKLNELQAELHNEKRTNNNLNDLINRYQDEIQEWKEKYEEALDQNTEDLHKEPDNPLLLAEREALEDGDFELTAQLRESYYRKQLKDKRAEQQERLQAFEQQLVDENRGLSHEALIAGERWESANKISRALPLYQEAVEIDPANREAWLQITVTAQRLGNTQLALKAIRRLQQDLDPEKDIKWLLIALSHEGDLLKNIGNSETALDRYQQSMQLTMQLVEAEPQSVVWRHNLFVNYDKVGDIHKARGDGDSALRAYEDGLVISKILVDLNPKQILWLRDLSVGYGKIGNMLRTKGDNVLALKAYEEGLAICKKMVEINPKHTQFQRDLSVAHNKLGDIYKADGDSILALKAYEDGLSIAKILTKLDPMHTQWHRDLFVSHIKIGDVHQANCDDEAALKAYDDSLAIAKKLVMLDPKNTEWQNDLSISYERVGEMHEASGDFETAMAAYENKLKIDLTLVNTDLRQTKWQRDLSISYNKIGDIYKANGNSMLALSAYEESLRICRKLVGINPSNVEWQTGLVVSYYNLSQVQPDREKDLLTEALGILEHLNNEGRLDQEKQGWIPILENALTQ